MEAGRRSDFVTGAVVVVLAGLGIFWLVPAQTTSPQPGGYDIAPSLVPQLSLVLCLLLGFGLMFRSRLSKGTPEPSGRLETDETGAPPGVPITARGLFFDLAVWVGSSVLVMLALPHVGFVVTGTVLLAGWLVFTGVRSVATILAVSLVLPVALDRLCWYALTVQLP